MIRRAKKTDFPFVFPIIEQIFEEMDMKTIKSLPQDQFYDLMKHGFYSDYYRYSHKRMWVSVDSKDRIIGLIDMYSDQDQELIDFVLKKELSKVGLKQDTIIFSDKEAQKDEWCIDAIAVHPDHWGEGVASELLEYAVKIARQKGYFKLSLNVDQENSRAQQLYEYRGFKTISTLRLGDRQYDHMVKKI